MDLSQIGEKVYGFALIYSIIITVISMSLFGAGFTNIHSPLFIPSSTFYNSVSKIANNIPKNATLTQFILKGGSLLAGAVLQFSFTLLFGIIAFIQTLSGIIPTQLSFLIPPLYFIGGFLQFVVWYYIITKILNSLSSIIGR